MTPIREHTIRKVTLRYVGPEQEARAPALQLRIERALRMVDWQPRGMNPRSILLIRKLTGLPALDDAGTLPDGWEELLENRLQTLYDHAVRPRNGFIPADAESVLFEDEVDLTVQLTTQLLRRSPAVPYTWYWDQIIRNRPTPTSTSGLIKAIWGQYVTMLPMVCVALPRAQLVQALQMLTQKDAVDLIGSFQKAFQLPAIRLSLLDQPAPKSPSLPAHQQAALNRWLPPWEPFIKSPLPPLPAAQQLLAGWVMMVRHAPGRARSEAFARAIDTWMKQTAVTGHHPSPLQKPVQSPPTAGGNMTEHQPSFSKNQPILKHTEPQPPFSDDQPILKDIELQPSEEYLANPPTVTADKLFTRLGGLFFLINVIRRLDLPKVWDDRLSGWAAIEAIAITLLGGRHYPADPVWLLLATLDGREDGAWVGADIDRSPPFSLPIAWGTWAKALPASIHSHDNKPEDWPLAIEAHVHPAITPWLQNARPYLTRILLSWLSSDSDSEDKKGGKGKKDHTDLIASFLLIPGRFSISNTHIDVTFKSHLAHTQLRRAGLDFDPGWVPELGYIVQFHFDG